MHAYARGHARRTGARGAARVTAAGSRSVCVHATSCARPHGTAKWAAYVYIRTYVAARRLRCVACVGNWGQRSSEHTQELNFENILFVQFFLEIFGMQNILRKYTVDIAQHLHEKRKRRRRRRYRAVKARCRAAWWKRSRWLKQRYRSATSD